VVNTLRGLVKLEMPTLGGWLFIIHGVLTVLVFIPPEFGTDGFTNLVVLTCVVPLLLGQGICEVLELTLDICYPEEPSIVRGLVFSSLLAINSLCIGYGLEWIIGRLWGKGRMRPLRPSRRRSAPTR
jgi:hypothetical protein